MSLSPLCHPREGNSKAAAAAQVLLCPGTHVMSEGVRGDPGDGLPQHLGLVVDALDGEEDLAGSRTRDEGQGCPLLLISLLQGSRGVRERRGQPGRTCPSLGNPPCAGSGTPRRS